MPPKKKEEEKKIPLGRPGNSLKSGIVSGNASVILHLGFIDIDKYACRLA